MILRATRQDRVHAVIYAAVLSAMSDFAALLLAYGREPPISDAILAQIQEQVLTTLKNSSATGMPLELQALAFSHAAEEAARLSRRDHPTTLAAVDRIGFQ